MEHLASIVTVSQIAAAMAVYAGLLTTLGQAFIAGRALESIARQPEAAGSINTAMVISLAMAETNGIYGLVVALLLLFANPLVNRFMDLLQAGVIG
jgi:F-type H+-transporting ATPase subunit c